MKGQNKTNQQLIDELMELRQRIAELEASENERKRAEAKLNETNKGLQILQQITASVHSTLDLEEVFRQITDGFVYSMGFTSSFFLKLNEQKTHFEVKALSTKQWILDQVDKILGFSLRDYSFPVDTELNDTARRVMKGEMVVVKTAAEVVYPLISKETCSMVQRLGGIKNYIVVPLQVDQEVVGGVIITSTREEVSEEELKMVKMFSQAASHAIQNANLLKKNQQAEEALRENEEKYRMLYEYAGDGIYTYNAGLELLDINKIACENIGLSKRELLGKDIFKLGLLHPDDISKATNNIQQLMEGKEVVRDQLRFKFQDGHYAMVEVTATTLKKDGRIVAIHNICRNITERVQAEEALRESEDRYRDLVEHSHDLICTHDLEGRILSANKGAFKILGYDTSAILNKNIRDILAPKVRGEFDSYLATLQREGVASGLMLVQTSKGEKRIWEYHNTLRTEGVPTPIVRGMAHDITERKRAEDSLQESEHLYRTLIENSLTGIYMIREGRYVFTNEMFNKITGYSSEDLKSMDPLNLIAPEERESIRKLLERRLAGESVPSAYETRMIRKDGMRQEIQVRAALVLYEGKPTVLGNIIDITEHKETEEALRESEENAKRLAQENAAVAEIGRIISSTLNIEEVYERFAEEVRKLIPFDRIAINTINYKEKTVTISYVIGVDVVDSRWGSVFPLSGSFTEKVMLARSGLLVQTEDRDEVETHYPSLLTTFQAGLRSMMSVPLISKDQVIGTLHLRSLKPDAYTELDLSLAERVGYQIAGAIANSQLFLESKRAEASLAYREKLENLITSISTQFINLEPDEIDKGINEVLQAIGEFVGVDRSYVFVFWENETKMENTYEWCAQGVKPQIDKRKKVSTTGFQSWIEKLRNSGNIHFSHIGDLPPDAVIVKAILQAEGIQSILIFPMISKGSLTGFLGFDSRIQGKTWSEDIIALLKIVGDIILNALERKWADEALWTEKKRFQTLIENSPFGIAMIDPDGTFKYINTKFRELFGYDLNEIPDEKNYFRKAYPDPIYRHHVISTWGNDLKSIDVGERRPRIFTVTCKDGAEKIINFIPVQLETGENLISCEDITERKRAEGEREKLQDQLRQSQKMEAVGRLAGGIAHDFNNLLTVMQGYCELSSLVLQKEDPVRKNIQGIRKVVEKAAALTHQLLAFSRRQVMELKVVDLNSLLRNLEKMLGRIIGEDIELVTVLSEGLGRVRVDPGQMEQVIMNLSVNARDAMPLGGKLTIETADVELDEEYVRSHVPLRAGSYVMFSMSDTGVGMSREVREHIFEPFFTTKERGKGTGLGLSTVYGIVQQSGGGILVYSEPGEGSVFKVYLPRVEGVVEGEGEEVARGIPRGDETVLVVEDDEEVRRITGEILRVQGYTVMEASDGEEGILICGEHRGKIDLMVTDVVMPRMGGLELVERVGSICPGMKVLYMSGYTDRETMEGGMNYIQKPFTIERLARKVREVLDK